MKRLIPILLLCSACGSSTPPNNTTPNNNTSTSPKTTDWLTEHTDAKFSALCQRYNTQLQGIKTEQDFAKAYHLADTLQLTWVKDGFAYKIDNNSSNTLAPYIKGLVLSCADDKCEKYRLLKDFKFWSSKANVSATPADNDFIQVQLLRFSLDSLEDATPAWVIMPDANTSASLCGRGIHSKVLNAISLGQQKSPLFQFEYQNIKENLLDDLVLTKQYWLSRTEVLKEIDAILKANYTCLSNNDRIQLRTRQEVLAKDKTIKFDLFNGE